MRAIIVKFHSNGKSYGEIAKTLNVSKKMVFNAIHYFRKNKTTKRVPRKQRPRKTSAREDELIVRESKKFPQKSANEIRVSVFGENNSSPSVEETFTIGTKSQEEVRVRYEIPLLVCKRVEGVFF